MILNLFRRKKNNNKSEKRREISKKLKENIKYMNDMFSDCYDVKIRVLNIASNSKIPALLVYISNLTPDNIIEESVIKKLTSPLPQDIIDEENINIEYLGRLLGIEGGNTYNDINDTIDAVLDGSLVLFLNGSNISIAVNLKSPPSRSIERPEEEISLRGPREAFIESIAINTCLIRKKIKSRYLKMEHMTIGKQTKTDIVICYLSNIANPKIVGEVKQRLGRIDIDSVLDANYIDEYIADEPYGIFPTIFRTEKPDIASSKLLGGRVLILVDGTPQVISTPSVFIEFLTVGEDYYLKFIPTSINRWVRYILFFVSILLPGFYVSLLTFHQELIPTGLLITIVKSRGNIPFPALAEAFITVFIFDAIREAGLRMPKNLGQAISIVGGLVLGEAAVGAGLISELMVIVVAFTGISSFVVPYPEMQVSIIAPRLIFLILGGTLGLLGLNCGLIIMVCKLISKRSFGVPFMSPVFPLVISELDDMLMRAPLPTMNNRSKMLTWKKSTRRKERTTEKRRN